MPRLADHVAALAAWHFPKAVPAHSTQVRSFGAKARAVSVRLARTKRAFWSRLEICLTTKMRIPAPA